MPTTLPAVFIGMITAITILIIHCFAHGEDACCGVPPHHRCFWNSSLGEHTLPGKSASLRHLGSMHHGDCVCPHLPDAFGAFGAFGGGYNEDPYLSNAAQHQTGQMRG
jgi:hypothetical protein